MHSGRTEIFGTCKCWVDRAASDLQVASAAAGYATSVEDSTDAGFATSVAGAITSVAGSAIDVGAATAAGVTTAVVGDAATVDVADTDSSGAATAVGAGTAVATAAIVGAAGFSHLLRCTDRLRLRMVFGFP